MLKLLRETGQFRLNMGTPIEHHENYRAIVFPSMSRGNIPPIEPYSVRLDFSAKSLALSKVQQNCTTINSFGRGYSGPTIAS